MLSTHYLILECVYGLLEYIAFHLSFCLNAVVIEPSRRIPWTIFVHASLTSLALSAVPSASSPQQIFTCFCMLLVDPASLVLINCCTVTLQPQPQHMNTCARWPPTSTTVGTGSKNAYTGEFHFFIICTRLQVNPFVN